MRETVVLLDSGVNAEHPIFKDVTIEEYIFDDKKDLWIRKKVNPQQGHGTAIAGIICSNSNVKKIVSFKIFEERMNADVNKVISALEYIYENIDCRIINMSFGITYYNTKLKRICEKLDEKGVVCIAAYDNMGTISYPAAFKEVIGVDASFECVRNDDIVFIGNDLVNLVAKGGNQRVAWHNSLYMVVQGASYATGYVTAKCISFNENSWKRKDYLNRLKEISKVHLEQNVQIENDEKLYDLGKLVVFPYSKEIASMIDFFDLLKYKLVDVYDVGKFGKVGKVIKSREGDKEYTIKSIESCEWNSFDTFVLGHVQELDFFSKGNNREKIIQEVVRRGKNLFCFDTDMAGDISKRFSEKSNIFYCPHINYARLPQKFGKMYKIKTPVLAVVGTSNKQGKFTLQLKLRKKFLENGYMVKQLGSEPEALRFGMEEIYPFGFRTEEIVKLESTIEMVNYQIAEMDKEDPDIIIAGSQAGTIPMRYNHISNYALDRIAFLLGVCPDAVILCVNYYDSSEEIVRTIQTIEGLVKCKVIAISVFPLTYQSDWDMVRGVKSSVTEDEAEIFSREVEERTQIPVCQLGKDDDQIFRECIKYFGNV